MIQIIGLVAAALTTAAFFPQAVKTLRTRDTSGISLVTYGSLVAGLFLWLAYGILAKDTPIILANAITLCPATAILLTKLRYG
jgi:MtN3 and saliva related transmembrane protein